MGSKTATLHVRVSPEIKAEAEELFAELGITTSYAVSMFLRQCIMRQAIPFNLSIPKSVEAVETECFAQAVNLTGGQQLDEEGQEILRLLAEDKISLETACLIAERKHKK